MSVALLIPAIPAILPVWGLVLLCRGRERPRWLVALGWLSLWVLPAVAYQTVWWVSPGTTYSIEWHKALLVSPIGLWVLLGGRSSIEVFEATARSITGHRQCTMGDNMHVYVALTAIQCAILIAILLRRPRPWRRDWVALAIGALVLVNALLGSHWPWWGT